MLVDIWTETFALRFGVVDRSDRLTLASTFDFFQEAAISHAENLGVGREVMARLGRLWVLSRISVFMERRPRWGETVTVRSWPRGWEKLLAIRDYDIQDVSGRSVIRGRGSWVIMDIERRRPLRPQTVMDTLPLNEGQDALPDGGGGLEIRGNLHQVGERKALYSDIDYNGHVNNARYIQWIQDITEPETLERADKIRLDINYLSEVKPGETIGFWTTAIVQASSEDAGAARFVAQAVEGRREGEQPVFRAELRAWANG
ncbi:MAG: acyl-ACP thioesterase [Treponema sp.]|jgi:acyl-ACP thioesterase|nr:acyl-ACP thioesterase [Treponema sp.]